MQLTRVCEVVIWNDLKLAKDRTGAKNVTGVFQHILVLFVIFITCLINTFLLISRLISLNYCAIGDITALTVRCSSKLWIKSSPEPVVAHHPYFICEVTQIDL